MLFGFDTIGRGLEVGYVVNDQGELEIYRHYQLVSIHPFADGNGRVARLLTMLYLGIRDYDNNGSIVLDSYYAQDRGEYYAALHNCQGEKYREGQDITSWVSYFVAGFLSAAKALWAP